MSKLKITIDALGRTTIQGQGFEGNSCQEPVNQMLRKMGGQQGVPVDDLQHEEPVPGLMEESGESAYEGGF